MANPNSASPKTSAKPALSPKVAPEPTPVTKTTDESPFVLDLKDQPHDTEAELCVLGAALLNKTALREVLDILRPEDFYNPFNADIYSAITTLYDEGTPVDAITVASHLQRSGDLRKIGGAEYIHSLIAAIPNPASAGYYCRLITTCATQRELITTGARLALNARETATPDGLADLTGDALKRLEILGSRTGSPGPFDQLLNATLATLKRDATNPEGKTILPTGIPELDTIIGGFRPGHIALITTPLEEHASALLYSLTTHSTVADFTPTLLVIPERSPDTIVHWLLSNNCGVSLKNIENATFTKDEKLAIDQAGIDLSYMRLHLSTTPHSVQELRTVCRSMHEANKVALIGIDNSMGAIPGGVDHLTRELKPLAMALGVPIVIACLDRSSDYLVAPAADTILTYTPDLTNCFRVHKSPTGDRGQVTLAYDPAFRTFTTADDLAVDEAIPREPAPSLQA